MSKVDSRDIPQNIIDSVEAYYDGADNTVKIYKVSNSSKVALILPINMRDKDESDYGFFYHLASVASLSDDFSTGKEIVATKHLGKYDILALESCLRMGYKAEDLFNNKLLSNKFEQEGFKQILWKN